MRRAAITIVATVVAIAAVAVALSSCAAPPADDRIRVSPTLTRPVIPISDPSIQEFCPDIEAQHLDRLPGPFEMVYICRAGERRESDNVTTYGPWESAYRVVDPAALVTAYRHTDAVASTGDSHCWSNVTTSRRDPLIIWVHRGDDITAYYAPVGECGLPTREARDAYDDVTREMLATVDSGAP